MIGAYTKLGQEGRSEKTFQSWDLKEKKELANLGEGMGRKAAFQAGGNSEETWQIYSG